MKRLGFFTLALTASCGGAVSTSLIDGGTDDGASDATQTTDATQTSDASPTCDSLIAELTSEQPAAIQCCPTCNVTQCGVQVEGLCCPLTVTDKGSSGVKAYESTLAQIKALKCVVPCPGLACSTKPTGNCMQSATCAQ